MFYYLLFIRIVRDEIKVSCVCQLDFSLRLIYKENENLGFGYWLLFTLK